MVARPERGEGMAVTEKLADRVAMEPLSPELALVDPELARLARDRLPDPVQNQFIRVDEDEESSVAHPLPAIATRDVSTEEVVPQGPRPGERLDRAGDRARATDGREPQARASNRARWRNPLLLAVGLVLVAAAFFALTPTRTSREVTTAQVPNKVDTPVDARTNTGVREARKTNRAARPTSKESAHPARVKKPAQAAAKKPAQAAAKKPAQVSPKKPVEPSRPSAFGPLVFVWPAVEHATLYKVAFSRNGKEVFEGFSLAPRLKLPLRWVYKGLHFRLTPGTYSWTVWPAFGPRTQLRYGAPIIVSTWVARR